MATQLNNVYLRSGGKLALALGTDPTRVYGSIEADVVTIAAGVTVVLDGSFGRGNDTIRFTGNAASYSVVRVNASTVRITDAAGTSVTIPVGSAGTAIEFADATRTLSGSSAGILLGNQTITATPVALAAGTAPAPVEEYVLTSSAPTVTEGNDGTKTLTYLLTLNKAPTSEVTVNYQTTDAGTAAAGDDFQVVAGIATFAPGQTATTVSVTVYADTIVEVDETVALRLSGSKLVAAVDAIGTIRNDDSAPVDPSAFTVTAGDIAAANSSNVPVTLNVGDTGSKTVTIQSDGASATQGIIINGNANSTITAGAAGDALIISGNGNNVVNTGAGNDTVTVYGSGSNTINVGTGNDTVVGGSGDDRIIVAAGNLNGGDAIDGGAGYDIVEISGDGNTADVGPGGNLVNIEELVLNGTTVSITEANLEAAIAAGLVKITGHPTSSVVTVVAQNGGVIDLSGLNLSGIKEIKVDASGGNATIKLSAEQIAQIGTISEQGAINQQGATNLTIDTTVSGYQALANKAPGVTVTLTDTIDNLLAAGNSISGITASLGDATVAQAREVLASGLDVTYTLVDSAANLALAPVDVFGSALSVTVIGTATAAQASAIQDALAAVGGNWGVNDLTMSVVDTASNVSNYLSDAIDADTVSTGGNEALTVAQANALAALNVNATFKIVDTAANLVAGRFGAGMARASEITSTDALTVAQVAAINAATTDIKAGYALSDTLAALQGAGGAAALAGAGNLTVNGGALTVAQALTVGTFTNTGTKSFALEDSITNLLAASSSVRANASTVSSLTNPITASQINGLMSYGAAKIDDVTLTVSDTVNNLLNLLRADAVGEASAVTISGGFATVAQAVALAEKVGVKLDLSSVDIFDNIGALTAAVVVPSTLDLLDDIQNAGGSIALNGTATVAQVVAVNQMLDGVIDAFSLADTAERLVTAAADTGSLSEDAVQEADAIDIIDATTMANVNAVLVESQLTAGTTLTYAIRDTAATIIADANSLRAAATTLSITDTNVTLVQATALATYANFDDVYAISDGFAAFDGTGADAAKLAILNGATSATLVDTKANIFNNLSATELAVADVVTVDDALANMSFTNAQLAEIDRLAINDTNLTVNNAVAVNAVAALKPATYSVVDSFADLTPQTPSADLVTYLANATTVVVDDNTGTAALQALTVAEFNALDALTSGTIQSKVTGTVAQLTAADAATAVASALAAANGGVTITGTPVATVDQAATLLARGVAVGSIVVNDTAAAIEAASATLVGAVGSFVVTDNGLVTGSVALASKVYGTDGSPYGNYAIVDGAAAIVAASVDDGNTNNIDESELVKFAQSVTVTGTANRAEAEALVALSTMGPISYSISDTAANVALTNGAALNGATNITATGTASLAQARTINDATNSGTTSYSISDSAAALAVALNDVNRASKVSAIENASGTVTANTTATAAEASLMASYAKPVVYNVQDTPAALAASTGLGEANNIVSTGATATAAEAASIMAAGNSGTTIISAVQGTGAEIRALTLGANDTITTLTVTGTVAIVDAVAIVAKDTGNNVGTLLFPGTITGTYAELVANATVADMAATVVVNGALSIAEAVELRGLITGPLDFSVTDSFANIMADSNPAVAGIDIGNLLNGQTVTVNDTWLTVDQADDLVVATGADAFTYTLRDSNAALVQAINSNASRAIEEATTILSADGQVLQVEDFGTQQTPLYALVGTKAQLDALGSVLQGAQKVYDVTVAELVANPDFFIQLGNRADFRVVDTVANLTSGNALVPSAIALVATDAATVAEATTLTSLGVASVTYSIEDDATAIATAAGNASVIDGAVDIVVTGNATYAQAATIVGEANTGTLTMDISDTGTAIGAAIAANANTAASVLGSAGDIVVTGTITAANVGTVLDAENSGSTSIALVTGTAAQLAGLELGANDQIDAVTPSGPLEVAQLNAIAAYADITAYSLTDDAEGLAAATDAQLDGATAIIATGNVTVDLAARLVAADVATTQFQIADTAANILAASPAVLAADFDLPVTITDQTVSASVASQLRALDAANNGANNGPSFTIVQGGNVAGDFGISDSAANLTALGNAAAVAASNDVRVTGEISIAEANAVRTAVGQINTLTYNVADTYSRLVAGLTATGGATNVRITNTVTVSQANSAAANFGASAAELIMDVRDTASAIWAGLVAGQNNTPSPGLAAAESISVNTSATVLQAARLSEITLVGGYAISDDASTVTAALNTANGLNVADRETVLGATGITLTSAATVAQALGDRGTEARGLYTIPGLSYAISDTAAAIITGLNSSDGVGIENATSVRIANAPLTVEQADILTALANFDGHDGAGAYDIADLYTEVQTADSQLLADAVNVRANGDSIAETIDMSGIGRAVYVNGNGGADILFGTDFADIIDGGTDADDLTGGTGRDAFRIEADGVGSDSTDLAFDQITDFTLASASWAGAAANDSVAEFQALTVGGEQADILDINVYSGNNNVALTVASGAGITAGILDVTGALNLAAAIGLAQTATGSQVGDAGETLAFEFGGNTYVFTENDANDVLVELTAVTGVTGLSLLAGGNQVGGDGYIIIG